KNSTYILINEKKTWTDARSYCREHYTDLASVRNLTENQKIFNLVQKQSSDNVWIGLFKESWEWSDQSTSLFRYWASTQPDNAAGTENCTAVSMADQGRWHDVNGNIPLPFVCHENKLILIQQNLTWSEALRYCRLKHLDLVSVHSEEIQLWVMEVSQKASTEHVWLGLRHTCTLSFWFWVSGESICYQNWAPGNGTGEEDCVSVERTGAVQSGGEQQWVSLPEDQKLNFICTTYEAVCGVSAYVPHRYHFINQRKTWSEAQSYCRQNYTDLATINDMKEMRKLNETLTGKLGMVWIGLRNVTWQWSLQDGTIYNEGTSYKNWKSGEPNSNGEKNCVEMKVEPNSNGEKKCVKENGETNSNGEKNCVEMDGGGKWNDEDCKSNNRFVCFEGGNTNKYILISDSMSWSDAQSYCRKNHTDLASVRNQAENEEIKNAASGGTVWIGLYRDPWKWSDQSNSLFRYWQQNQSDNTGGIENCTTMVKNGEGRWNDAKCDTQKPFICYEKKTSTYILINEEKTWTDARSYCRQNYTDLASVRNLTENQKIFNLVKNQSSDNIWIGLIKDSWEWSDQSSSFFRYWASTQPDNSGGTENCTAVSMADQGRWHNVNGNIPLPFVCHEMQVVSLIMIETYCARKVPVVLLLSPDKLILVEQNLTWREALRYCRENHVDLVSVHSEEIQFWVKKVSWAAFTKHVWLGLRHTCKLSFWFWVSGEFICYQNWAPGNGTEGANCGSVERTGAVQSRGQQKWVSLPEDQKLNFICTTYEAVCGVSAHVPHRYHFINQRKTWSEAQSYCRQTYTDLATINTMEEMRKLSNTVPDKLGMVWIGLRNVTWQWALQDGTIYKEGTSYKNWNNGEPNSNGKKNCVEMDKDGKWNDEDCSSKQNHFVCFEGGNTNKYMLISDSMNWSDAQSYCREKHTDLASVRNQPENDMIKNAASGGTVWIRLYRNSWEWSDQSSSLFRYWAPTQPDNAGENCTAVFMADQGRWHDVNGNIPLPFVCHENQLILIQQNLTWREALWYCRENHLDLVSVHSEEIQFWVMEVSQKASTKHVWLGLRHTCAQGLWYWVSGFSICFQNWAPAVCGVSAYVPHRYHFINQNKTWSEAQSYCRQKYTDLATINTMEEMRKLSETVPDKLDKVWIGLRKVKWQWSLQDGTIYNEGTSYKNWKSGEPNSNGEKNCVEMDGGGKWNDEDCSKQNHFVCFEGGNTNKYIPISDSKSWYDAQSYCRKIHTDLATVRNEAENEEIKKAASGGPVWIGLYRDPWKWSDQSNSLFRYWQQNQPDNHEGIENCTTMVKNGEGRWNDAKCETQSPFICYERINSTYILINEEKTWSDAWSYCRHNYTDLASVKNLTENQKIFNLVQHSGIDNVWIGLFKDSWEWSDQSSSLFRYWASKQPDNAGGTENCTAVSMADQGRWNDVNGNKPLPFVCHENKLILIQQNLTWREALWYCREKHLDLVSVHSEEIQFWVMEVSQKASTEHVWLGLRHTCAQGLWYWVSGFSICFQNWAPAVCGVCAHVPHRYHFINQSKTWSEAQSYCRQKYTDLATTNTMEEMRKLNETVPDKLDKVWIGLRKVTWQWSLQNGMVYTEGTSYTNWTNEQPNSNGEKNCVEMNKDGKWNDKQCKDENNFVCFEGGNTNKYIPISDSKSWYDAQSYCREIHTDLATVRNEAENEEIKKAASEGPVWIGLYRDPWKWSDQSNSSFRYWQKNQPDNHDEKENCTTMVKNDGGRWNDAKCETQSPFICYERKNSTYKLINEEKTWSDAWSYCRHNYTDLASVRNLTENQEIFNLLQNSGREIVWIGLFKDSWEWSDQSTSLFRYWASTQPDNAGGENGTAVSIADQGRWHDVNGNIRHPFVCHENKLILIQQNLTWSEALWYCREKHVDLVSVHSEEIQLWVMEVSQKASTEHVWLGLRHTCTLSFWFWVSGESICYMNWAPDKLILIKNNLTWPQALKYCREKHVDLVSDEIQWDGTNVAENATTEHVWLGLRYVCFLGSWFWVNGQAVCDYEDWAPRNGTGEDDCSMKRSGAMQTGGEQQWVGLPENQTLNFICTTYEEVLTEVQFFICEVLHEDVLNKVQFFICETLHLEVLNEVQFFIYEALHEQLEHPHTVPADGAVGVKVEGHQAFGMCDSKPFILVLTTVPPHMDSLVVSTKTKAGLVTEDDPLPF
ncbi:hypothetical protein NFI96_021530, partial [Prochilodus magdalenae]